MKSTILAVAAALLSLAFALPAAAQSLFAPVARVDDSVISRYELEQRTQFLTLFGTPGDVRQISLERLIEEKLQLAAAADNGIVVNPEAVEAGMDEFAGRVELTREEFLLALGQNGVSEETFRDFVRAGVAWREVVRARFGEDARPSSEAINSRLIETGTVGGTRVLLTEIVLPATDPATTAASRTRAAELSRITDAEAFREAARRFSQATSRPRSGDLDWLPLAALPESFQGAIGALSPGQTTPPLTADGAVVLFHMRDREELAPVPAGDIRVEYVRAALAREDALAHARAEASTCTDLVALAGSGAERETQRPAEMPPGLRSVLEGLDANEIAALPGSPGTVVMLCSRQLDTDFAPSREAVFQELNSRGLAARAARYLAQLRADATITILQ